MGAEERVPIRTDADIIQARKKGRTLAETIGFAPSELVLVTTAISELARNILLYAKDGEIRVSRLNDGGRDGILLVASDKGPGIPDVGLAMQSGYSTSGNLGLGLPGVRRLMDEMGVNSTVGMGTTVTAKKWKR